jgi:UDP-2,3-diacylglucosamine pyrophosphatase LpxH
MNRKIIFSDLHLGGGGKNDNFSEYEKQYTQCRKFIDHTGEAADICFAGDIYDLREDTFGECVGAHVPVAMEIERASQAGRYVKGNHDAAVPVPTILDLPGSIRVIHGHIFDNFNSGRLRFIGDTIATAAGWFEKRGLGGLWSEHKVRKVRSYGWRDKAWAYMEENDITTLFLGHTHEPGHWCRRGRFIVNTGCWVRESGLAFAEILYLPAFTRIRLYRWTRNGPRIIGGHILLM